MITWAYCWMIAQLAKQDGVKITGVGGWMFLTIPADVAIGYFFGSIFG